MWLAAGLETALLLLVSEITCQCRMKEPTMPATSRTAPVADIVVGGHEWTSLIVCVVAAGVRNTLLTQADKPTK